jgi:hypothetical protein
MVEEYAEIQLNFRRTVPSGQGVRLTQSYLLAGKITQVLLSFPPGCLGLVDLALTKDERPFYPSSGYLTLDNASPVFYTDVEYYAHEPLTLEIRNRDAGNPHTPTCAVTIRFKKPSWW